MRQDRLLVVTLAALVLAGCGVSPLSQVRPRTAAQLHAKEAQAEAIVAALREADAALTTMTAVASFWETDGHKVGDHAAEVTLAKPGMIRAHIIRSTDSMKRGVTLVYRNDHKVRAKLGFFKKTFAYDDPTVCSLNGYRIDQTNYESIVGTVLNPEATVTYAGTAEVGGAPCDQLEVKGPGLLPGADREVLALDRVRHLPARLEVYEGTQVVYRLELSDMKVNPHLPKDAFDL